MTKLLANDQTLRLAATLGHFCWQGLAIAALAWAASTLARRPNWRYAIACGGMLMMLAAPIGTFVALAPAQPAGGPTLAYVPIESTSGIVIAGPVAPRSRFPIVANSASNPSVRGRLVAAAPWAVVAWSIGVGLLIVRHAVGFVGIARLRRRCAPLVDSELVARLRGLADRLGVTRPVALLACVELDAPAVIGWLRPAILWPAAALVGLTPAQLDALLAHELAHVRRHDYAVNLIQTLVETLLFYHPAVWWLGRRIRQEREHCCDDVAATLVGDRVAYAESLVAVESLRRPAWMVISSQGGSLMVRIKRLVVPNAEKSSRWPAVALVLLASVVAVGIASRPAARADPASPSTLSSAHPGTAPTTKSSEEPGRLNVARSDTEGDYRIAPNDLVDITIWDLTGPGKETVIRKRVTASGGVSLPYVNTVQIGGHTEADAESLIGKAYTGQHILSQPIVSVTAIERTDGRNVPIVGNGATARGDANPSTSAASQPAVSPDDKHSPLAQFRKYQRDRQEIVDEIERVKRRKGENDGDVWALRDLLEKFDRENAAWSTARMGEYYVSGHVARPGVYSLSARKITLKQAMISAGSFDSSARDADGHLWIELVRRTPETAGDEARRLDWDAIGDLQHGDFYLMPDDQINVGVRAKTATAPATPRPETMP